ncbi:hypothetical protein QTN25_007311 [Entamoeba marina]
MSQTHHVRYGSLLTHVNSENQKRKYFDSAEWANSGNGRSSPEDRETIMSSPPATNFIQPHKEDSKHSGLHTLELPTE